MKCLAVALLLVSAVSVRAQVEQRIVLLRGRYKAGSTAIFNYAGEMQSAAHGVETASQLGLNESERVRLERVVQHYQAPVAPAGQARRALYVLLDEDGQAVTSRFGTSFMMVYPGGDAVRVDDGFVDLGNSAPERPITSPWWAWLSAYNRRFTFITQRAVQSVRAPVQTTRVVPPAPHNAAGAPAPVMRAMVYPVNYSYVAPPRPVRPAIVRASSIWRPTTHTFAQTPVYRAPVYRAPVWTPAPAPYVHMAYAPAPYVQHFAPTSFALASHATPVVHQTAFMHAGFPGGGRRR